MTPTPTTTCWLSSRSTRGPGDRGDHAGTPPASHLDGPAHRRPVPVDLGSMDATQLGTIMVFPAPESGDQSSPCSQRPRQGAGQVPSLTLRCWRTTFRRVASRSTWSAACPATRSGTGHGSMARRSDAPIPEETARPMTLTYEISDGSASDSATVIITVISADAQNEARSHRWSRPGAVEQHHANTNQTGGGGPERRLRAPAGRPGSVPA